MPQCRQERKKYCIFTIWPIYNFGRSFLGHYYYILSWSDLCLGVKQEIFKKKIHVHYMTCMATLQQKKPCPGSHEDNFDKPFLGHHYNILNFLTMPCNREEVFFLKKYINFTLFTPQLPSLGMGGNEIHNFSYPYHTDARYQIWF